VYWVSFFTNNVSDGPDAFVYIINPGLQGTPSDNDGSGSAGNLCANLYVFDANQELQECCSCLITPNGLLRLSVKNDLTANPLTSWSPVHPRGRLALLEY
jgi:hypothetical protein